MSLRRFVHGSLVSPHSPLLSGTPYPDPKVPMRRLSSFLGSLVMDLAEDLG